jgi:hypothetical protein
MDKSQQASRGSHMLGMFLGAIGFVIAALISLYLGLATRDYPIDVHLGGSVLNGFIIGLVIYGIVRCFGMPFLSWLLWSLVIILIGLIGMTLSWLAFDLVPLHF